MIALIALVFVSYAITFIVVDSDILSRIRRFIADRTPWLCANGVHMLDCRMCSGFWVSLLVTLCASQVILVDQFILTWLCVYGASYFLATQERQ